MVDFSKYSFRELEEMVNSLNSETIPDDALIRRVSREIYDTDNENVLQMSMLALPIATELVNRINSMVSFFNIKWKYHG